MKRSLDKPGLDPGDELSDTCLKVPHSLRTETPLASMALSLEGIVLLDEKNVILEANAQALEFLHSSLPAVSGYSLWDVLPPEVTEQHEEATETALCASRRHAFVVHQSFENSWVEYNFRRHAGGRVVNLREAAPVQKYQRLLEDSKRYNKLIFEANPNAMWVFDLDSLRIFAVNQAAVRFYGIGRKAFMALGMEALFPEGEGAELLASLRPEGGGNDGGPSEMRLCKQKKMDGTEVLVELAWSHIRWDGRRAMLVSLADISDRHLADTALKKVNAELQRSLAEQAQELQSARHELLTFTQAVSSDLQDSLHVANGFATRLAEKYAAVLDESGRHYVRRIQASIGQLSRLVDDLRTLVQLPLDCGTPEAVDLAPVCLALVANLRKSSPQRNVTLEMDGRLLVQGNRRLLSTALSCLLENAWKFTSKKPEAWIKVGLLAGKGDDEVLLVVSDNGAGFDPMYGAHLFTAFQRLHSSADFPGNGLGLAIIKRVAQLHGGTAWAESPDQAGASFFMTLAQGRVRAD